MGRKFIGRETELTALREKYRQDGFQMAVIYGRRRIGKTTMINKFIDETGGRAISFVAVERQEKDLLKMMGDAVMGALHPELAGMAGFESFEKIFDMVAAEGKKERIIFFIDEYPYLVAACPYMNSLIQKYVDYDWKDTEVFLILCGSLVSFMKDEVLSKSAPLHGRSTLEFRLRPFGYYETGLFFPDRTAEERAMIYGLTGGVAKYIEQIDPEKSLDENIADQFFSSTGYFTEEQIKTVITGEKQSPGVYSAILEAIANGHTAYNEIATAVGMQEISYYLKMLTKSEFIEKRVSGHPYYVITDGMLIFWFRYVSRAASLINAGKGKLYYENVVKGRLHEFMGPVFEDMAKEYIWRNIGTDGIPLMTEIGEYQASVKDAEGKIRQIEIDLLGKMDKKIVLAGECKFRQQKFGKADLDAFNEKIRFLPADNVTRMLFSLRGFTDAVEKEPDNLILTDLHQMYV